MCNDLGRDTFVNYGFYLDPPGGAEEYEKLQLATAREAEMYGDVIFNAPVCQSSYLTDDSDKLVYSHGFISIDDDQFCYNIAKFDDEIITIVHAPTSMAIKGTPFVREAINRLRQERSDFVYLELQNTSHHEVIEKLHSAHICLNQFFSFGTGVLGVEAMASRCATLMSADPNIEPSIPLPDSGATPWMITQSQDIYDNVKLLLNDRLKLKKIADEGFEYALENYSLTSSSKRLRDSLIRHGFEIKDPLHE
jgi:glycosyltransferase involved in cell wall biosynthesis